MPGHSGLEDWRGREELGLGGVRYRVVKRVRYAFLRVGPVFIFLRVGLMLIFLRVRLVKMLLRVGLMLILPRVGH